MSRKKKRRNKRRRKFNNSYNTHHILWMARSWNRPWARKLRSHPYMTILIPMNTLHRTIHEEITCIPVLPEDFCKSTYEEINRLWEFGAISENDTLSDRLELLIFILDYTNKPTVDALKKQLRIAKDFEWREFCLKLP